MMTITIKGMEGTMAKEKGILDQGNVRPSKKARNYRYEESNVVNNKKKEYYLIPTLSTRHFGELAN